MVTKEPSSREHRKLLSPAVLGVDTNLSGRSLRAPLAKLTRRPSNLDNGINMNSYGLDSVNISLLPADDGNGTKALPLLITPRWDSSNEFLMEWSRVNRQWLDERLIEYGAILVRGFALDTPADMQQAIQAYHPHLNNVSLRTLLTRRFSNCHANTLILLLLLSRHFRPTAAPRLAN